MIIEVICPIADCIAVGTLREQSRINPSITLQHPAPTMAQMFPGGPGNQSRTSSTLHSRNPAMVLGMGDEK